MAEYEINQAEVDGEPVAVINGTTDEEWICVEPKILTNVEDVA